MALSARPKVRMGLNVAKRRRRNRYPEKAARGGHTRNFGPHRS